MSLEYTFKARPLSRALKETAHSSSGQEFSPVNLSNRCKQLSKLFVFLIYKRKEFVRFFAIYLSPFSVFSLFLLTQFHEHLSRSRSSLCRSSFSLCRSRFFLFSLSFDLLFFSLYFAFLHVFVISISCFRNKLFTFCLSVRYLQLFPLFIVFGVKSFFYFVEQGRQIVRFVVKTFLQNLLYLYYHKFPVFFF